MNFLSVIVVALAVGSISASRLHGRNLGKKVGGSLDPVFENKVNALVSVVLPLANGIVDATQRLLDDVNATAEGLLRNVQDALNGIVGEFETVSGRNTNDLTDSLPESLKNILEAVQNLLEAVV